LPPPPKKKTNKHRAHNMFVLPHIRWHQSSLWPAMEKTEYEHPYTFWDFSHYGRQNTDRTSGKGIPYCSEQSRN
jgi:hypothetical protein